MRTLSLLLLLLPLAALAQTLGETRLVERPTLHVVSIGIDQYADNPLQGAVNDAVAVDSAFAKNGERFFGHVESHLLTDSTATYAGIESAIATLERDAQPEDTVVLFFAGVGLHDADSTSGDFSLVPYGGTPQEGPYLNAEVLSLWLSKVPARRLLVIVDACSSPDAARALTRALTPRGTSARSLVVVAPGGIAFERESSRHVRYHGTFTLALLDQLDNGRAQKGGGMVTAHELAASLPARVASQDRQMTPIEISITGVDFALGVSDESHSNRSDFHFARLALSLEDEFGPDHPRVLLARANGLVASLSSGDDRSLVVRGDRFLTDVERVLGIEHQLTHVALNIKDALARIADVRSQKFGHARLRGRRYHQREALGLRLEVEQLSMPPVLRLQPLSTDTSAVIVGHALDEQGIASVEVNGRMVETTPSGQFSFTSPLGAGATTFTIRATDAGGAVTEERVTVEPPALRRGPIGRKQEQAPLPPRRDMAVFFATDDYLNGISSLVNPIADAVAIAAELRDRHGFDTLVVRNPTKEDIERTLIRYEDYVFADEEDSQLFVFFAGHGTYVERLDQGFIQPADAFPGDRYTYYRMRDLANSLDEMTNFRRILLVLDVCYGGAVFDGVRDGGNDELYAEADRDELLRRIADDRSRLALTSGGVEYVSDGVSGRHSPFAARILEALRNGAGPDRLLFFQELVTEVQKTNRQEPRWGTFARASGETASLTFVFAEQDSASGATAE